MVCRTFSVSWLSFSDLSPYSKFVFVQKKDTMNYESLSFIFDLQSSYGDWSVEKVEHISLDKLRYITVNCTTKIKLYMELFLDCSLTNDSRLSIHKKNHKLQT